MQAKKVTNIRVVGHIKTMDIEVSNESHVFYGDGIATSNSHAVSYAINAYWSAYCKTYKIKSFYETYLNKSDKKPKPDIEKKQLIMDAKAHDIDVLPPRLSHLFANFTKDKDKDIIYYGLVHVKGVGSKECEKIQSLPMEEVEKYTWMDCLINMIYKLKLNKRAVIALISVGAFNGVNNRESRQKMLYEFDSWKQLSAREQEFIAQSHTSEKFENLSQAIGYMISNMKINSRRLATVEDIVTSLDKPFYDLDDKLSTIANDEEKYLSCSLTCNKVDGLDLSKMTNMCQELINQSITGNITLAVEIVRIKVVKTKNGKNPGQEMAFLTVEDGSGSLDSITVFPESYEKHKNLIVEGNTVLLIGEVSKKDRGSMIVNKISQI